MPLDLLTNMGSGVSGMLKPFWLPFWLLPCAA